MKIARTFGMAIAISFFLFTACSDTAPKAEPDPPGQEEPEPEPEPDPEPDEEELPDYPAPDRSVTPRLSLCFRSRTLYLRRSGRQGIYRHFPCR